MLLLAGSPGTGKTYLKDLICKEIPNFFNECSIDIYKEKLYEEIGFNNTKEKLVLDERAYTLFYSNISQLMVEKKSIISDYPFSDRQHDTLKRLAKEHQFQIITVTLICDIDTLYQRQRKRDLDLGRHLGFIMNHYHKGDVLEDRTKMDIQKSKAEFADFNKKRGYSNFKLGKTVFLDVSDFKKVNYNEVISKIKDWVK